MCERAASDAGGSGLPSGLAEADARADKEGSKAEERWKRMTYPAGRILHLVPARLRAPSCHPLPHQFVVLAQRGYICLCWSADNEKDCALQVLSWASCTVPQQRAMWRAERVAVHTGAAQCRRGRLAWDVQLA